jgi:hypothetical protein
MFTCIRCMLTLDDGKRSEEHVFPESIGGSLTLTELCKACNDEWGHSVDVHLVEHLYCQIARFHHQLPGKSGDIPNPFKEGRLAADLTMRMVTGIAPDGSTPPIFQPRVRRVRRCGLRTSRSCPSQGVDTRSGGESGCMDSPRPPRLTAARRRPTSLRFLAGFLPGPTGGESRGGGDGRE